MPSSLTPASASNVPASTTASASPFASLFGDDRRIFGVFRVCCLTGRTLRTEAAGLTRAEAAALSAEMRAEHFASPTCDEAPLRFEMRTATLTAQAAHALPGYGLDAEGAAETDAEPLTRRAA